MSEWQPINGEQKQAGPPILVALIAGGKVWRVSDAQYKRIGFYTVMGGESCHWATHWMPLPDPPSSLVSVEC